MTKVNKISAGFSSGSRWFLTKLFFGLVGAACFTIVGVLAPSMYFLYFDKTEYISYSQPIKVDKAEYKPCENVEVSTYKDAKVNIQAYVIRELFLARQVDGKEKAVRIYSTEFNVFIPKDNGLILGRYTLPCDIDPGTYYWKANLIYKYRGGEHTYSSTSERFKVIQDDSIRDPEPTVAPKPSR